jgi:hypothetical protein
MKLYLFIKLFFFVIFTFLLFSVSQGKLLTNGKFCTDLSHTCISLFDGKHFGFWSKTAFKNSGDVEIKNSCIVLSTGRPMTGITWKGSVVRMNYEINLDAMRIEGNDFFCGLTFPVGLETCSFIVGGWDGQTVGLSSIDHYDAHQNITTDYMNFESNYWYHIKLRVTMEKIEAWIDERKIVNFFTTGHYLSIRDEVCLSKPLGIATYWTTAALKNITITAFKQ